MGDISDYYSDLSMIAEYEQKIAERNQLNNEFSSIESLYNRGELKWRTKDGQTILIQDMTWDHLQNSINYLKKGKLTEDIRAMIYIMLIELIKRIS